MLFPTILTLLCAVLPALAELRLTMPYGDNPILCSSYNVTWEGATGPVFVSVSWGSMVMFDFADGTQTLTPSTTASWVLWDKVRLLGLTPVQFRLIPLPIDSGLSVTAVSLVHPLYRFGDASCLNDPEAPWVRPRCLTTTSAGCPTVTPCPSVTCSCPSTESTTPPPVNSCTTNNQNTKTKTKTKKRE